MRQKSGATLIAERSEARKSEPVSIADEVKMHDELVALLALEVDFEPGPNDARITELTEKLCSTASGRKLLDGHLQVCKRRSEQR